MKDIGLCICGHAREDHEYRFSHVAGVHYGECLYIDSVGACNCNLYAPVEDSEEEDSSSTSSP